MAFIARLYDFTPSTLIQSSQVDAEFQQLVDILGGGEAATQVKFTHSSSADGLTVDNTGGGIVQAWKVSGVEKLKVNVSGQLESVIATGTAPFVVASTTAVANLNADQVDGVHGTNLLVDNAASQEIDGGATTALILSGDTSAILTLQDDDGVGQPGFSLDLTAGILALGNYWNGVDTIVLGPYVDTAGVLSEGTTDEPYATETYVDAMLTTWSFGVFYAGGVSVSVKQAIWVIPNDEDLMTVTRMRWITQSGSPTGTTQIKLQHKNSAGAEQNSKTISILIGDTLGATYDADVSPDWSLASGDYLEWTVIADGGHQDISIHAQGEQSIY